MLGYDVPDSERLGGTPGLVPFEVEVWNRMAERSEGAFEVYAYDWEDARKQAEVGVLGCGDRVNGNEYKNQFVIKSITCGSPQDLYTISK